MSQATAYSLPRLASTESKSSTCRQAGAWQCAPHRRRSQAACDQRPKTYSTISETRTNRPPASPSRRARQVHCDRNLHPASEPRGRIRRRPPGPSKRGGVTRPQRLDTAPSFHYRGIVVIESFELDHEPHTTAKSTARRRCIYACSTRLGDPCASLAAPEIRRPQRDPAPTALLRGRSSRQQSVVHRT